MACIDSYSNTLCILSNGQTLSGVYDFLHICHNLTALVGVTSKESTTLDSKWEYHSNVLNQLRQDYPKADFGIWKLQNQILRD